MRVTGGGMKWLEKNLNSIEVRRQTFLFGTGRSFFDGGRNTISCAWDIRIRT
jgi:hypothetical protein